MEVLANCLLAWPTDFAIDLASMSGKLLPNERGIFTPRTVLRRVRVLRAMPPAMPTAAAPTATAGPAALPAALFTVSTTPLPLPLLLAVERERVLVLVLVLGLDPFVEAREALVVDRVERVPLFAAAGLRAVVFFLAPGPFRLEDLVELLDRFVLLRGVLEANANPLLRRSDSLSEAYPIAA